ncbi:prmC [Symbiodinium sp. KB8]|nr:prmC [Symbiodinium sp. KB8]
MYIPAIRSPPWGGFGGPTRIAYSQGSELFCSHQFRVSESVMVPRRGTEAVAQRAAQELKVLKGSGPRRLLDLGTGSGCIAISALLALEEGCEAEAVGLDSSAEALAVAQSNAENLLRTPRHFRGVEACFSDLGSPSLARTLMDSNHAFDVVVANPPYLTRAQASELLGPKTEAKEPWQAFVFQRTAKVKTALKGHKGDVDGAIVAYAVLLTALDSAQEAGFPLLKEGGALVLEVPAALEASVRRLVLEAPRAKAQASAPRSVCPVCCWAALGLRLPGAGRASRCELGLRGSLCLEERFLDASGVFRGFVFRRRSVMDARIALRLYALKSKIWEKHMRPAMQHHSGAGRHPAVVDTEEEDDGERVDREEVPQTRKPGWVKQKLAQVLTMSVEPGVQMADNCALFVVGKSEYRVESTFGLFWARIVDVDYTSVNTLPWDTAEQVRDRLATKLSAKNNKAYKAVLDEICDNGIDGRILSEEDLPLEELESFSQLSGLQAKVLRNHLARYKATSKEAVPRVAICIVASTVTLEFNSIPDYLFKNRVLGRVCQEKIMTYLKMRMAAEKPHELLDMHPDSPCTTVASEAEMSISHDDVGIRIPRNFQAKEKGGLRKCRCQAEDDPEEGHEEEETCGFRLAATAPPTSLPRGLPGLPEPCHPSCVDDEVNASDRIEHDWADGANIRIRAAARMGAEKRLRGL